MKVILFLILVVLSCTKQKDSSVIEMDRKISSLESELSLFDEKIKNAIGDPGKTRSLQTDKELLGSRLKRLYEKKRLLGKKH